jgi:hypothetical protein
MSRRLDIDTLIREGSDDLAGYLELLDLARVQAIWDSLAFATFGDIDLGEYIEAVRKRLDSLLSEGETCKHCKKDIGKNDIRDRGPHLGLHCMSCGVWVTWLPKHSVKLSSSWKLPSGMYEDSDIGKVPSRYIESMLDSVGTSTLANDYNFRFKGELDRREKGLMKAIYTAFVVLRTPDIPNEIEYTVDGEVSWHPVTDGYAQLDDIFKAIKEKTNLNIEYIEKQFAKLITKYRHDDVLSAHGYTITVDGNSINISKRI